MVLGPDIEAVLQNRLPLAVTNRSHAPRMAETVHLGFCLALCHWSAGQPVDSCVSRHGAHRSVSIPGSPRWYLRRVVHSGAGSATIGR